MKSNKKAFLLIEITFGVLVVMLAYLMVKEKNGDDLPKISVVIQNSDDNQWKAFRYGLRMAAEDHEIDLYVTSTEENMTIEEQKALIEQEIEKNIDGLIVQPVSGKDTEKMLKKLEKRVPIILVESVADTQQKESLFPVVEPKHYEMGVQLAKELLSDYNDNLTQKTIGLFSENRDTEAVMAREQGVMDTLKDSGARISWCVSEELEEQAKVDFVLALDDKSLVHVGKVATAHSLHGALIYGIGKSTEAVYYLDTGVVTCLLVPDEFNMGYQSLTEMSKKLNHIFYTMEGKKVSYSILRRDTLFLNENQDLLFTMSQ